MSRKRWLFRGIVLAVPFLSLLLLEAGLRLAGYGLPMDLVLRETIDGEARLVSNPFFTWLFFEPNVARLATPFWLEPRKPPSVCRVFVFGSSAAQGDPEPGFGLARFLEVLLRDRYPGVEFEVLNTATTAINSHVVYAMAQEAVGLEPDVFVVYAGNNEVVGPFGAGTVLSASSPGLAVIRAGVALRRMRTGQLVRALVRRLSRGTSRGQAAASWRGMEMFLDHPLRSTDPAMERTYANYERNLADTIALAHGARVPLVLSTVAVNLRGSAPFGSLHHPALSEDRLKTWDALYKEGRLAEAAAIDDTHAELQYRLGRSSWSEGRYDEARDHYRRAVDLDSLRFRADSRINAIVRRVAERAGQGGAVHLVDAARVLENAAPHGTPGEEAFLDHVHLTFAGNYQLSVALFSGIQQALPERVRAHDSGRPLLSQEDCARGLVFTELDRYRIAETMAQRLSQPPFTRQMDHDQQMARFTSEMAALRSHGESGALPAAVAEYQTALGAERPRWEIRERYAVILRRLGNVPGAEREWGLLARTFPAYPTFHLQRSRMLRDLGRLPEAESSLREVLRYQPESSLALVEAARLLLLQGKKEQAIAHARRALAVDPEDANTLYALATCLCRQEPCRPEERAEAISHLARAQQIAPDSEPVRRALAALKGS